MGCRFRGRQPLRRHRLIALIFELASLVFGLLGALVFITAGLLCLALQLAGVGRSRI